MNCMPEQSAKTAEKKSKGSRKPFRQCKDCPLKPNKTRTAAKVGMVATLGVSAASGILKFKGAKPLHLWASVAFVGFTALHWVVSKKSVRMTK